MCSTKAIAQAVDPPVPPAGTVQPHVTPVASPPDIKIGADITPIAITAAEAGRIALQKSPALRLARASLLGAHGNTIAVNSGLLPAIGLSASALLTDPIRGSGSTSNSSTNSARSSSNGSVLGSLSGSLSLTQLLFDFGHTVALVRQAAALETAASHGLSRAQQDVVYQTSAAYYLFSQNTGLVTVQEANVKDRQAQLDLARARLEAGPGEPADLLAAQTNLAEAIQQLVLARNAALAARISLALTMGIDARTPIACTASLDNDPPVDFAAIYAKAYTARPDLLQSLQQLRAAGYELKAAQTNNSPSIGLVGSFNTAASSDSSTSQSAVIGIGLTWAIFDGYYSRGRRISAQADLDIANANLAQLQLSIGSDVATAWTALEFARQRVPITQSEVKNAAESLRIASGRFKAGAGPFLAVTDAEASLVTAQQAVVTATTAVYTAQAALRHAAGDSK